MSKRPSEEDDPFLSSLTFLMGSCNCDECDGETASAHVKEFMKYKKAKLSQLQSPSGAEIPTQKRSLVKREDGVSIWRLNMPVKAQPFIEYGNSHRFVFVNKIPLGSTIYSIGTGVIGSSSEQKDRKKLDWKEGRAYLIPSNGGKALGWIHGVQTSEEISHRSAKDIELVMIKATVEEIFQNYKTEDENHLSKKWVQDIISIFRRVLVAESYTNMDKHATDTANENTTKFDENEKDSVSRKETQSMYGKELSESDTLILNEMIQYPLKPQEIKEETPSVSDTVHKVAFGSTSNE